MEINVTVIALFVFYQSTKTYENEKQSTAKRISEKTTLTSTPFMKRAGSSDGQHDKSPALSGISSEESYHGRDSDMSGVEAIQSDTSQPIASQQKDEQFSFVNPFNISIDVSEEEVDDSSVCSDEDYEPSVNITLGPSNADNLEKVTFDELKFGASEEDEVEDEEDMMEDIPGVIRILSPEEQGLLTDDHVHLVYHQPILNLARLHIDAVCNIQGCSQNVELTHENVGSALYIKWGIWFGVIHHVVNEHELILSYASGTSSCSHGPLTDERPTEWIKKGSAAHRALTKIVMDKRLLNNMPYFLNFRYKRFFNKKSSRWTVVEMKTDKQYGHIPHLINQIVTTRLEDRIGMQGPVVLEYDDPRRISRHLATVPPPSTQDLVQQKKSQLKTEDLSV